MWEARTLLPGLCRVIWVPMEALVCRINNFFVTTHVFRDVRKPGPVLWAAVLQGLCSRSDESLGYSRVLIKMVLQGYVGQSLRRPQNWCRALDDGGRDWPSGRAGGGCPCSAPLISTLAESSCFQGIPRESILGIRLRIACGLRNRSRNRLLGGSHLPHRH